MSELVDLANRLLEGRPEPLRTYDQIFMRPEDLALHVEFIAPLFADQRILFMGDSDGVALTLSVAAAEKILPSPTSITLCDFDMRVLDFVSKRKEDGRLATVAYNVFEPLPEHLLRQFDRFHTNPPFGRYNKGRSIMAFVNRSMSCCVEGAQGVIVLGNDDRYPWTQDILSHVQKSLVGPLQTTLPTVMHRMHRYDLDDQPELESGLVVVQGVDPRTTEPARLPLDKSYKPRFYGRKTIEVPSRIGYDEPQLDLGLG